MTFLEALYKNAILIFLFPVRSTGTKKVYVVSMVVFRLFLFSSYFYINLFIFPEDFVSRVLSEIELILQGWFEIVCIYGCCKNGKHWQGLFKKVNALNKEFMESGENASVCFGTKYKVLILHLALFLVLLCTSVKGYSEEIMHIIHLEIRSCFELYQFMLLVMFNIEFDNYLRMKHIHLTEIVADLILHENRMSERKISSSLCKLQKKYLQLQSIVNIFNDIFGKYLLNIFARALLSCLQPIPLLFRNQPVPNVVFYTVSKCLFIVSIFYIITLENILACY